MSRRYPSGGVGTQNERSSESRKVAVTEIASEQVDASYYPCFPCVELRGQHPRYDARSVKQ